MSNKMSTMLTTKQFLKLSRKKRAVIIAQDVIEQIKLGIYKTGHNYSTDFIKKKYISKDGFGDPKQEHLDKDAATVLREEPHTIKCEGCARASLFISAVKFKNQLTVGQVQDHGFDYAKEGSDYEGKGTKYLSDEFDQYQQALIETAFEQKHYGTEIAEYWSDKRREAFRLDREAALKFAEKVVKKWKNWTLKSARPTRNNYLLSEICKNIVKNEGVFKP